ncbi:DUF6902 family protein [Thalassococcus lentus]|uniref:DUF4375 domain-containing protein n=1 Tax=Thalassococcus lentus TaxID=1210524 RepID=A0ABT4XR57_9RHOB|nr:hypothetical protein [Thalassococcus lentus]MDA7424440.1 hypothetical protein [Thalassococcus lentus]
MSNVISLAVPSRIEPLETRLSSLVALFARERRTGDDVFWLKENAELLNILECTGQSVAPDALAVHGGFYASAMERLQFFPQYYRFLLSLALDLEDLGMPGEEAAKMVDFAHGEGLAEAELSDLQRAEARRLMARRGIDPVNDPFLNDRLRTFASRTKTFALPNKKAAYELTHIVFYLSEYGRRDPNLTQNALKSLHFAGLTAFLDQNADLLSEICTGMVYAGEQPPAVWTAWLAQETRKFELEAGETVSLNDAYHEFLVCNWHAAVAGEPIFRKPVSATRTRFDRPKAGAPLREISQTMMALESQRSGDWDVMRRRMEPQLSAQANDVLNMAAESSDHFDAFFEGFARAGRS